MANSLRGLCAAERLLKPGGRLAVVTFHSLEDRIVKQFLSGRSGRGRAASRRLPGEPAEAEPTFEVPRGQPIEASEAEAQLKSALALGQIAVWRSLERAAAGTGRRDRGAGSTAGAKGEIRTMWRILHAFAIAALIGSAAYVYGVKYRTIYASEQLVKTRHLIDREKDAINLLRAEYAHLARPDRVQALADSKLGLEPLALSQIATVNELPDAQPEDRLDRPRARIAGLHRRQFDPGRHRLRLDSAGEVRNGRDPDRLDSETREARRGRASSSWTPWLTSRSLGSGAICRRISASIWSRRARALRSRQERTKRS